MCFLGLGSRDQSGKQGTCIVLGVELADGKDPQKAGNSVWRFPDSGSIQVLDTCISRVDENV